jgi:hypothetical protein
MSDKGRTLAQDGTLVEKARGSLRVLPTMPPQPITWLGSGPVDAVVCGLPLALFGETRDSTGGPFPGGGCAKPDPFSTRSAISERVNASIPSAGLLGEGSISTNDAETAKSRSWRIDD